MTSAFNTEDLELSISQNRRSSKDGADPQYHRPPYATAVSSGNTSSTDTSRTASITSALRKDSRLSHYNIIKTLGEGSFGKVKLAIHQVSQAKVALKIISRKKLITRDMAGRIEREIQYLQLLRHPHIIKLYTVITSSSDIIMVLEYAGGELFDYIVQNGKMPEEKARKFFQQIVCAVEYCHRHKIVHRDLKPENLLLDENLNVKIADFGLSNIMTDGNFLKTSCGSPNYAAPEVISGKLYAGPEVDVWSCGVILYVLLVGRLPFDDEYIPALFKKIAQGNYMVPNYLSSGAVRLIRRMLQVNPVNRISVPEIRMDPWFMKDLAEYLQPPVEEFIDTGVDPTKAIDPYALSKDKPKPVQEKLHGQVVMKLGKTMGYAPGDVQEALGRDEPSAIKDAYLIVRENQLMKTNPALQGTPFTVGSPEGIGPKWPGSLDARTASLKLGSSSGAAGRPPSSPMGERHPRQGSNASSVGLEARSPASTVAILTSSLPDYHKAFMEGSIKRQERESPTKAQAAAEESEKGGPQHHTETPRVRTKEDQEITARMIKGRQNRGTVQVGQQPPGLQNGGAREHGQRHHQHQQPVVERPPEPLSAIPDKGATSREKKTKPTKWQFGIRSRNTPAEAMLAIYKALAKMGAVWEEMRPKEVGGAGSGEGSPERGGHGDGGEESPEYSDSDPDAGTDPEYASREEQEARRRRRAEQSMGGRKGRERYGRWNDWGYSLPEDPWVIQARFRKEGMFPPGVQHPSSTHSSRVDLTTDSLRRRPSTVGSLHENVAAAGPGAGSAPGSSAGDWPQPDERVWVYVSIQLYSIERDFYLVDFKCAGYERLVRRFARKLSQSMSGSAMGGSQGSGGSKTGGTPEVVRAAKQDFDEDDNAHDDNDEEDEDFDEDQDYEEDDDGERLYGAGRTEGKEKEISSPFPFLDVASKLIIQLAESND